MKQTRLMLLCVCLGLSPVATVADESDYLQKVKPLLAERCFSCHGALQQRSGLRLDTVQFMRQGGDSGPVVVPGQPADSLLLGALDGSAGFLMPPDGEGTRLTGEQVQIIREWIKSGAHGPADEAPQVDPGSYWSYQPVTRPQVPTPATTRPVRTPVDAFLAARHQSAGVVPVREAAADVLLRRVYFDLIGLPPTRDELHRFLADPSDDAYRRIVNDLLSRPQYGERWGRHWMDVWRYSDWYGRRGQNEMRYGQRHLWRWRDWIVESLNSDKGYDRMLHEMLAGDELAPADPDVLRATGYLGRSWYKFDRNVWLFETVEQTGQAFLGMTLRCSRCHDHKFDPIQQEEYYRFRAFFEPHNVRTDPLSIGTGVVKDQTLGEIPADGVSRVYDKDLDAVTYRFERGNDRSPDKSKSLTPGVPAALGTAGLELAPVQLPVEAFYPLLQSKLSAGLIEQARAKVDEQKSALAGLQAEAQAAKTRLTAATTSGQSPPQHDPSTAADTSNEAAGSASQPAAFLTDDFAVRDDQRWKVVSGNWAWEDGHLSQKTVSSFATVVTTANHPRNFTARVRYRTLQPGGYRSVGFSFDYVDQGNSQDVYTATGDQRQTVQAFHRKDGRQVYPQAGIVDVQLKVGEITTVEVTVRESLLKIVLNGEERLNYVMPEARRDGCFALWVHNGAAEFLDVELRELLPDVNELAIQELTARHKIDQQQLVIRKAEATVDSLAARIAAERASYGAEEEPARLAKAMAASRAQRQLAVIESELAVLKAQQALELLELTRRGAARRGAEGTGEVSLTDADRKPLVEAQAALNTARQAVESADGTYEPLGEIYPPTSSGRRLALARWMTHEANPRTARVAVNHLWLRHFGEAIVPSVSDFGLHGQQPSHPELLDWLAAELMEQNWSMKHIHRLIVLSSAYRLSSQAALDHPNRQIDPENTLLWRMNSRRLEAEVVRDRVLAVSGVLDLTQGGAELPPEDGQTVFRRSLYFRVTPDDRMKFLELFDQADPNGCYRRQTSIVPQQALALSNSDLALGLSRKLAGELTAAASRSGQIPDDDAFVRLAFEQVLSRPASADDLRLASDFLAEQTRLLQGGKLQPFSGKASQRQPPAGDPAQRARENLVHVLFCHNEFLTIR